MSFFGHKIVHDRKNTFFHLPSVLSSKDDHFSLLKVKGYTSFSSNIFDVLVGTELTGIENIVICSIRKILIKLLRCRFYKHVCHEQSMIWSCANYSNSDSFGFFVTSISVNNINSLSTVEIVSGQIVQHIKRFLLDGNVNLSPSDIFFSDWIVYDSLCIWWSTKNKIRF